MCTSGTFFFFAIILVQLQQLSNVECNWIFNHQKTTNPKHYNLTLPNKLSNQSNMLCLLNDDYLHELMTSEPHYIPHNGPCHLNFKLYTPKSHNNFFVCIILFLILLVFLSSPSHSIDISDENEKFHCYSSKTWQLLNKLESWNSTHNSSKATLSVLSE